MCRSRNTNIISYQSSKFRLQIKSVTRLSTAETNECACQWAMNNKSRLTLGQTSLSEDRHHLAWVPPSAPLPQPTSSHHTAGDLLPRGSSISHFLVWPLASRANCSRGARLQSAACLIFHKVMSRADHRRFHHLLIRSSSPPRAEDDEPPTPPPAESGITAHSSPTLPSYHPPSHTHAHPFAPITKRRQAQPPAPLATP